MKTHTTEGAKIMREHIVEWLADTAFIVEQHHERHDGKAVHAVIKAVRLHWNRPLNRLFMHLLKH